MSNGIEHGPVVLAKRQIVLEGPALERLEAAFEQMDLLLDTRHDEAGLANMVSLLVNLRALKRAIVV